MDGDVRAGARERERNRAADPSAGAGDQRVLVADVVTAGGRRAHPPDVTSGGRAGCGSLRNQLESERLFDVVEAPALGGIDQGERVARGAAAARAADAVHVA